MGRRLVSVALPDNVTAYRDRHGKLRLRFRKRHCQPHTFKSPFPSPEFEAEYDSCKGVVAPVGVGREKAGTIDDLCVRYYSTPAWKDMAATSQATYRGIIERFRNKLKKNGKRYGELPAAAMTTANIDKILGDMSDTPAAANNLRKVLKRLFRIAVKAGMRTDNPATETDSFKSGEGFHTWTEEEIAQYRTRHPLGSKARLALELALNTAARRCNVARLRRDQLIRGKFHIQHAKGNDATIVECLPETRAAIDAMPVAGLDYYIVTEFGKPFTVPGFGNKVRQWCDEAGLPQCSIHGLRKAMSRRLAESGASDAQGRSVTGQKKNQTFAYYAAMANREALADDALANLKNRNLATPE